MSDNNVHINYTKEDIEKYLLGKMTPLERNAIEKAALQDPFLADAIEGYEIADMQKANSALDFAQSFITASAKTTQIENNYTLTDIEKYVAGEMTTTEMHAIEKAALQDSFLADAIEGYTTTNITVAKQHLSSIATEILGKEKEDGKVISMGKTNTNKFWLRIAAAILLMVGAGSTIWLMNKKADSTENPIAQATTHEEVKSIPSSPAEIKQPNSTNTLSTPSSTVQAEKDKLVFPASPKQNLNQANTGSAAIITEDNVKQTNDEAFAKDNKNLDSKVAGIKIEDARDKAKREQDADAILKKEAVITASASVQANKSTQAQREETKNFFNNNNNASNVLKGRVLNTNGDAVVAANVNVKSNNRYYNTITDNQGYFSLQVPDTTAVASVQSLGYNNQRLQLNANQSNSIILENNQQNLSEVVVVGYGTAKRKDVTAASKKVAADDINSASPVGGWDYFNQYVHQKKQELSAADSTEISNASNNDIVVEFKVDNNGKPYSISTSGSDNEKTTQKAVEIIKQGPKWTTDKKNKKVKVIIKL